MTGTKTATATGTAIPIDEYSGVIAYLNITAASGTTPTLDIKFQDSPDNVTFHDIPSAAFTQAITTGTQRLSVTPAGRYIRAVATITGTTPSFTFDIQAAGY
jgi:hypothetical protein